VNALEAHDLVLDTSVNALEAHDIVLDTSVNALEAHDLVLDASVNALEAHDLVLDTSVNALEAHDLVLDTSVNALEAHDVVLDTSVNALEAHDVVLDTSVNALEAHDIVLDASMNAVFTNLATEKSRAEGAEATKANLSGAVFTGEVDISGLKINGIVVNSSAGDINKISNVTDGIASANKALVVDSSKNINGLKQITANNFVGDLCGNAITATNAKNDMCGNQIDTTYYTISDANDALTLKADVTGATLENVTVTTNLNISGGFEIMGTPVNSNATQLNTLIVTPGQATESKALVVDSNRDISGVNEITATKFIGDISGNATSATQLETPRTIGGVAFDGTSNIDLPGVNTQGNQDTTGNAVTATNATNDVCGNQIDTTYTTKVSFDASMNALDASVNALDASMNALEAHDIVLDTSVNALEAHDLVLDTSVNALEAHDVVLDASVNALEAHDDVLDASMNAVFTNLATEKSRAEGVEATKANLSGAVFTGEVDISGGLKINGEVVDSNATQLNTLIVTPGQATESKALVVDSNRDISGVNEITATKLIGDISGNATTATQLETPRNIGGVNFDGTSNIDLSGVNVNVTNNLFSPTTIGTVSLFIGQFCVDTSNGDLYFATAADSSNNWVKLANA